MPAKCVLILTLAALVIGSAAVWLYFEADVPKKMPVRARQVLFWGGEKIFIRVDPTISIIQCPIARAF